MATARRAVVEGGSACTRRVGYFNRGEGPAGRVDNANVTHRRWAEVDFAWSCTQGHAYGPAFGHALGHAQQGMHMHTWALRLGMQTLGGHAHLPLQRHPRIYPNC